MVAYLWLRQTLNLLRVVGLVLGFVGVAFLAQALPPERREVGFAAWLAGLFVAVALLCAIPLGMIPGAALLGALTAVFLAGPGGLFVVIVDGVVGSADRLLEHRARADGRRVDRDGSST